MRSGRGATLCISARHHALHQRAVAAPFGCQWARGNEFAIRNGLLFV